MKHCFGVSVRLFLEEIPSESVDCANKDHTHQCDWMSSRLWWTQTEQKAEEGGGILSLFLGWAIRFRQSYIGAPGSWANLNFLYPPNMVNSHSCSNLCLGCSVCPECMQSFCQADCCIQVVSFEESLTILPT